MSRAGVMVVLVVLAVVLLGLAGIDPFVFRKDAYLAAARRDQAVLLAKQISDAAAKYRSKAGEWPRSLSQLTAPDPATGTGTFLASGDVLDPWGQAYHFEVRPDGRGGERAVVWTTDPDCQRLQWPPAGDNPGGPP